MNTAFKWNDGFLKLAKMKKPLKIKWSYPKPEKILSITVSKDSADRYFVSMLVEFEPKALQVTPKTVGIDLGINSLFTTDTGEKIGNPRHTQKYETKLAKAQRKLAKKQNGSANREKARAKVARIHAKIADSRLDNLHKLSRRLINENQVICVETLKVKNMIRNPKLSKHIADASWGEFVRQLKYKAEWAGRTVSLIDQFFPSSKRCSCCGYISDKMPLNIRSWSCPSCKEIGITQKSAWGMLHKLREAMSSGDPMLGGIVEIDETYIGGKEKNKHAKKKQNKGRGAVGK